MNMRAGWMAGVLLLAASLTARAGQLVAMSSLAANPIATFGQAQNGVPLISLDGQWRFHPGDDATGQLGWAKPGFDDSEWLTLHSDQPWNDQGATSMDGYGWYRFRVTVAERGGIEPELGILLPPFSTGYEIFADGQRIGSTGSYEKTSIPFLKTAVVQSALFELPREVATGNAPEHTYQIALRVWSAPSIAQYYFSGPSGGGGMAGPMGMLRPMLARRLTQELYFYTDNFAFAMLAFAIAIFSLGLFWFRRRESEYLWFALVPVFLGLNGLLNILFVVQWQRLPLWDLVNSATEIGYQIALLVFVSRVLGLPLSRLRKVLIALGSLSIFTVPLYWTQIVTPPVAGWIDIGMLMPVTLWVLGRLTRESMRGNVMARLMLAPVALMAGLSLVDDLTLTLWQVHLIGDPQFFEKALPLAGFHVHPTILAQTLFLLSMMGFLIDRFTRARRREEHLVASMEAARQVQRLLLPEAMPEVAGLEIECAYYPSEMVGGDFFLAVPTERGGLIALLGDVSGKGLPASMLVAMLVGAARAQMAITTDPASILNGLNAALRAHRTGHLATCLVCHLAADGLVTLASAGHPAPYRNGSEMEMAGALPLGAIEDAGYEDSTLRMEPGDRLMLISDGILEAQDGQGNLLGFAAAAQAASLSAHAIAEAALAHGQTDDITALAVTRVAV